MHDGGPAFPVMFYALDSMGEMAIREQFEGMTLRDWFAGQALAGIALDVCDVPQGSVAERCYALADAMIAAREGGE